MKSGLHRVLERRLWVAVLVFAYFSPLVLLAAVPPRGAERLVLFAIGIGFVGFVGIVIQLILPSRAPQFTVPFGIGPLLRLHRFMGLSLVVIIGLHVGVFVAHDKQFVAWLLPIHGPIKAQVGWAAAVALLLIVSTSLWRGFLRIKYEWWRLIHIVLGIILVVGASVHVLLISWYSAIEALRWFTIGGVVVGLVALLYLRIGRPFSALGVPYVIAALVPERGGAMTLQLQAAGHAGVPFSPGQFAWLRLSGRPFALMEHPFSYASSSHHPARPCFTVQQLGDFTSRIGELEPGMSVLIDGPHGAYEPALPEAGFCLIVAGIGVTPAMSFLRTCADAGDLRPIRMVYGARSWESITFRDELLALEQRLNLELVYVLSQPEPEWTGLVGRITPDLLPQLLPPDADSRNHFVCGPAGMIDDTLDALNRLGIPDALVYADRFDSV